MTLDNDISDAATELVQSGLGSFLSAEVSHLCVLVNRVICYQVRPKVVSKLIVNDSQLHLPEGCVFSKTGAGKCIRCIKRMCQGYGKKNRMSA